MATKAKKLEVKKSVLDWCKDQVSQGHELKIHWDGGGDSGWCHFEIDGKEVNNEYTDYLVDCMYSELDYGSWAGEFTASGVATFNPGENCFEGIDDYREDERVSFGCNITLKIPNHLWYERINIRIEIDEDSAHSVEVAFGVTNGFTTTDHKNQETFLEEFMRDELEEIIEEFTKQNEFRDIWQTITLLKSDGIDMGGYTEFRIDSIDIGTYTSSERDIVLYIEEDEKLPEDNKNDNDEQF